MLEQLVLMRYRSRGFGVLTGVGQLTRGTIGREAF